MTRVIMGAGGGGSVGGGRQQAAADTLWTPQTTTVTQVNKNNSAKSLKAQINVSV